MKCVECLKNYDYYSQCPVMSEVDEEEAQRYGDKLCRSHRLIKEVRDAKAAWYGDKDADPS